MSNKSVIPSHKHCIKKLREIKELKKKKELNDEQREKISKEKFYKDIIRTVYQQVLERIPDEVQQIILEYLDVNTRLKMLRLKYTPEFAKERLAGLLHRPKRKLRQNVVMICIFYNYVSSNLLDVPL